MWEQHQNQSRIIGSLVSTLFCKRDWHSLSPCNGESSVIINWDNDKENFSTLDLDGWCDNIMELKASFHTLDFHQVFREDNKRAYSLSKEALPMVAGLLSFTEYYEKIAIGEDKLQLF